MRVALAEDRPLMLGALQALLRELGLDVIHAATDGPGLLDGIEDNPPDVVILDARMPPHGDEEGFITAQRVHERHPEVGVLILSDFDLHDFARRLLEQIPNGVGYLSKDRVQDVDFFKDAIFRIAAGEVVIDDKIAERIAAAAPQGLTKTEHTLLSIVAKGYTNRAVGRTLFMSDAAVERHLTSIFRKLKIPLDEDHNRRVLAILRWLEAQGR
jgi:DNA-binding NarL/FixJ family response regulator